MSVRDSTNILHMYQFEGRGLNAPQRWLCVCLFWSPQTGNRETDLQNKVSMAYSDWVNAIVSEYHLQCWRSVHCIHTHNECPHTFTISFRDGFLYFVVLHRGHPCSFMVAEKIVKLSVSSKMTFAWVRKLLQVVVRSFSGSTRDSGFLQRRAVLSPLKVFSYNYTVVSLWSWTRQASCGHTHTHTHTEIYRQTRTCTRTRARAHTHTHTHLCLSIFLFICLCVYLSVYMNVYLSACSFWHHRQWCPNYKVTCHYWLLWDGPGLLRLLFKLSHSVCFCWPWINSGCFEMWCATGLSSWASFIDFVHTASQHCHLSTKPLIPFLCRWFPVSQLQYSLRLPCSCPRFERLYWRYRWVDEWQ